MHIGQEKLLGLAFRLLADVTAHAPPDPIRPSLAVRLALAVIYAFSDGDRWPFDDFWRQMRRDWTQQPNAELRAHCRQKHLGHALEAIRRSAGPAAGPTDEAAS